MTHTHTHNIIGYSVANLWNKILPIHLTDQPPSVTGNNNKHDIKIAWGLVAYDSIKSTVRTYNTIQHTHTKKKLFSGDFAA